ncbi:hypothetical protein SAMN05444161_4053 [Rhizobiales bacterium GAS191]|jgi:hypothetical protein|nr:hypothetical protein SAMN05519103_03351 [Rhizobiales bacterium GAS113]SED80237.1 hypothetical protein SAMN05444161_4053 [Rhizobiales bacterium GAS191]
MDRRGFVAGSALASAWPTGAFAETATPVRIGALSDISTISTEESFRSLSQGSCPLAN